MAGIKKFGELSYKLFIKKQLLYSHNAIRFAAVSAQSYEPGPEPRTEEERLKAAEKYGLHPREYKPLGGNDGDYPDLPAVPADLRNPYYPWDNSALRQNFGETLHKDEDALGEDRYDHNLKGRISLPQLLLQIAGFLTLMIGLYFISPNHNPVVLKKQMPKPGVVHYSF